MKKKLLLALATVLTAIAIPSAALAAPVVTVVTGKVTTGGTTPVNAANVTVTCNGNEKTATTDNKGFYSVPFDPAVCPDGVVATATATKGGASGSNTGTVEGGDSVQVNVALVNVDVALPEMGTVISGIAALGAGGAFMIIRRKQQQNIA